MSLDKWILEVIKGGANPNSLNENGSTALILAAADNQIGIIKDLINLGADVNALSKYNDGNDDYNKTALMIAASFNYQYAVTELLENGADIDARNEAGMTALMYASWNMRGDALTALIEVGADVNARDNEGRTALMSWNANRAQITEMIDAGADVNARDNDGENVLHHVARLNVIYTLLKRGAEIDVPNRRGRTALMYAACTETAAGIVSLIESGEDVNAKDDKGMTALVYAAANNKPEVVAALINAGADVKPPCTVLIEDTAMGAAIHNKNPGVVKILIEAGTDINDSDDVYGSLLAQAIDLNFGEAAYELIAAGARVNGSKHDLRYAIAPLFYAVRHNRDSGILDALIKAGANVHIKDGNGMTLLMYAVLQENTEAAALLIQAGADIDAQDKDGMTALMYAADWSCHPPLVALLLIAGADTTLKDKEGRTVTDMPNGKTVREQLSRAGRRR